MNARDANDITRKERDVLREKCKKLETLCKSQAERIKQLEFYIERQK